MTDADPRTPTRSAGLRLRPVLIALLAAFVFLWVFLYRFNTLGGSFGGFDNDHFLQFAYAKQVQAGQQPQRDFLDGGLQGARPSLTYELSAAAQRYLGNNLRSEAWVTVSGVALGAAATFVAASRVAPWPWALITAFLSALVSPKLYSYPKVLVLAVASLLIVFYSERPTRVRLVWMSVWTAVAFLFRHDYAVYCGCGIGVVIVASHWGAWRLAAARGVAYGLLTVALLGPSLWLIHRDRGVVEYLRNGLEMSAREAERTDRAWPSPVLGEQWSFDQLSRDENTETWVFYLFLVVPAVGIALGLTRWWRSGPQRDATTPALIALGAMTLLLTHFFLRGNYGARFGDMAPPVAVIGAALLAAATARGAGPVAMWLARALPAIAILVVTAVCVWILGGVESDLRTGRLLQVPAVIAERHDRISQELVGLPTSLRVDGPRERMEAADYLNRCTRPSDRVLIVGYAPEVFVFAERLFAGGRATFLFGFYQDERYSRELLARLATESVPIVLAEPELIYERIPLIAEYLRSRYAEAGPVMATGRPLRVLARRGVSSHPSGPHGLPCFA